MAEAIKHHSLLGSVAANCLVVPLLHKLECSLQMCSLQASLPSRSAVFIRVLLARAGRTS